MSKYKPGLRDLTHLPNPLVNFMHATRGFMTNSCSVKGGVLVWFRDCDFSKNLTQTSPKQPCSWMP